MLGVPLAISPSAEAPGGSFIYSTDFPTAGSWPAGWTEPSGSAWRSAFSSQLGSNAAILLYFYCYPYTLVDCRAPPLGNYQILRSPTIDLSGMDLSGLFDVTLSFRQDWQADYPFGESEGWVEGSTDGFVTSVVIMHYEHNNPAQQSNSVETFDITSWAAGQVFAIQFRMTMMDDWWWMVDDFSVTADWAPPAVDAGGPYAGEEGSLMTFTATTDDPSIVCFRWDFDNDGIFDYPDQTGAGPLGAWTFETTVGHVYPDDFTGTVVVEGWDCISVIITQARVLIIHSYSGDHSGNGVPDITDIKDAVAAECGAFCSVLDDYDFGPLGSNQPPPLVTMLQYDALVVGTNHGPVQGTVLGTRLTDYLDVTNRGVVMLQGGFSDSDLFGIGGLWQDGGYSPIPRAPHDFVTASLGPILTPHPIMDGVSSMSGMVRAQVTAVTAGATHIADWTDGRVAVAAKEMINGARTAALNLFPILGYFGGDAMRAVANAIKWSSGLPVAVPDVVTDTADVVVTNAPPTVSIDSATTPLPDALPDQILVGEPVTFQGSFTDPGTLDTHPVKVWAFGDGYGDTDTLNPTHTYECPGTYTASLTVTDDDGGTDTDTMTITVDAGTEVANAIKAYLDTLPNSYFQNPGSRNQMKAQLNSVIAQINAGNRLGAIATLNNVLLPAVDGAAPPPDKITNTEARETVYDMLVALRDALQTWQDNVDAGVCA